MGKENSYKVVAPCPHCGEVITGYVYTNKSTTIHKYTRRVTKNAVGCDSCGKYSRLELRAKISKL